MRAGLWFLAFSLVGCSAKTPNYREFCERECQCTGCDVEVCVDNARELAGRQAQRSCRSAGDALMQCKLREGGAECQKAHGLVAYMPTDACKPELDALATCFQNNPKSGPRPKAQRVPPSMSFPEAMEYICSEDRLAALRDLSPSERATRLAKDIEENVSNAEVDDLFERLASVPATEKEAVLMRSAKRAGLSSCPSFLGAAR